MQALADFFAFKSLVTPLILQMVYIMGAVMIPLFIGLFIWWLYWRLKPLMLEWQPAPGHPLVLLKTQLKLWLGLIFFALLLSTQLVWRMSIEFFVVYFQIHDALQQQVMQLPAV